MLEKEKTIVISLGGSLIYTKQGLNIDFLRKFEKFIRRQVKLGRKFFIVCGGGYISRKYQKAAKETIGRISSEDVDWLGIDATRINAHLLRTIFKDIAHPKVIGQYQEKEKIKEPVTVAAGWRPGWSTDYDAVLLARDYGAKTVVNLSNIEAVYDKDPRVYPEATAIESTSWEYFRTLIEKKWQPGLSVPFDPVASKLAQELGLTVIITKGDDFKNLENLFSSRKFKGTVITPLRPDASFFDRAYFEEAGPGEYKGYTTSFLTRVLRSITSLFRAVKIKICLRPKSLLDVGCGDGKMIFFLRKLGVEAYGIDISKYILSRAHPKVREFLKKGDIENLTFPANSFEVVTTFDLLEHIGTEKLPKVVSECNRVAQKYVLHKIFTSENWWIKKFHGADPSHISVFSKAWWEKFWQENGFVEAKIFYPHLPAFMETLFILEKKK